MTSLASQLQSIASLDASRLTSRTGAPTSKSYLFPAHLARDQDLDAVYSLGLSGFEELCALDPNLEVFDAPLFSEKARRTDRMLLSMEENRELDDVLGKCLRRLGKRIGLMAGGKCIEWLVRRFRIHEMNAELCLQVFLPYHDSPHFPRMLAILTIPTTSPYYAPFAPLIKDAQPLPRSYIARAISPEREKSRRLLDDVVGMVGLALREGTVHRALLSFWTAIIVELLEASRVGKGGVAEGTVKVLVEAFVQILSAKGEENVNAAVYPPLVLLTRSVRLADDPFLAILHALTSPKSGANPSQRTLTLLILLNDRASWSRGLGDNAAKRLSQIDGLGTILVAAMDKYGFQDSITVIVQVMLELPSDNLSHLQEVLSHHQIPPTLVQLAVPALLTAGTDAQSTDDTKGACKTLLASLRERHPAIVDAAYLKLSAQLGASSDVLAMPQGQQAFTDVYGADITQRVKGIKEVERLLTAGDSSEQDRKSAADALIARLGDESEEVLQAIYEIDGKVLLQAVPTDAYLAAVRPTFVANQLGVGLIGRHLQFVGSTLLKEDKAAGVAVFEQLLFPSLLAVGDKQAFTSAHWTILAGGSFRQIDVLAGVAQAIGHIGGAVESKAGVVNAVADGIIASDHYTQYATFLISQLSSTIPSSRILAHLLLVRLVVSMRGDQQVGLAVRVLQHIQATGHRFGDDSGIVDLSDDATLAEVLAAPTSKKTSRRLSAGLLAAMAKVAKPSGLEMTWLLDDSDSGRQVAFKRFARLLYAAANNASVPPTLGRALLRSLLTQLGEEGLLFFASVWTSSAGVTLRAASLKHAQAFVLACVTQDQTSKDFQLVLPALLLALQDVDSSVRSAASAFLRAFNSPLSEDASSIYALETIYGPARSPAVQLLKASDRRKYLSSLVDQAAELALDSSRLHGLHATELATQEKSKKDAHHRRAVIAWLTSHMVAWQNCQARCQLLESLKGVNDSAKLTGVLPLLAPLLTASSEESRWLVKEGEAKREAYLDLVFGAIGKESVRILEEEDGEAWKFVLGAVAANTSPFASGSRRRCLARLADGVSAKLSQAKQVDYTLALVSSLRDLDTDEALAVRPAIAALPLDAATLVQAIQHMSSPLEPTSRGKRQKQDAAIEASHLEDAITDLSVLVELRDWKTLPGDADLVATLMGVLSALLVKRQTIKEGIDYLEQELLGAILAVVENIKSSEEIQKAHVGIEVIIKVIRASTNPRTSQRALLVASELARLIPDAVLHNIMPIFTFMGASDFQRDDAYSFGVVEKTVASIVPVMTNALKLKTGSKLELYTESRTFLSIFTDMAGRLPKHRTHPFFVHLVKSLGAAEFLAPVAMLLIDRTTTKAGRAGLSAAQAMDLPLKLVESFDAGVRVHVLLEVVEESARLVNDMGKGDEAQAFLHHGEEDDRTTKQVPALLTFATDLAKQLAGKRCRQTPIESTVKELILLAAKTSQPSLAQSSIAATVQAALGAAMQLLAAENFLAIIADLLKSTSDQDVNMALAVLVDRIPRIKQDVRANNANAMREIIKSSAALLKAPSGTAGNALTGLHSLYTTALPQEDAALAQALPVIIAAVPLLGNEVARQVAALSLVEVAIRHLASRAIPFVQSTIDTALPIVASTKSSYTLSKQAFATLAAVVETLPTFISNKQLNVILRSAIDHRARDEGVSASLGSTIAKKVPTKTLVSVVMDVWKGLQDADEPAMKAFFEALRQALRHADRPSLSSLIKPLFTFFLDVFDLRHRRGNAAGDIDAIEDSAIGSFLELVTKLNEATFKPLFGRLYDWAVVDLAETGGKRKRANDERLVERQVVLFRVMMGLLQKFKHLLSPYIGVLMPHIEELLPAYAQGSNKDEKLWTLLLDMLAKSFEVDDGAYWNEQLHQSLIPHLISQLPLFPSNHATLPATFACLASSGTTSEDMLKASNTALCLATRSDDPLVRLSALRCLDKVWEKAAEEMLTYVPETVGEFLAELLEDEDGDVERGARAVLGRIEGMTGSLKEYLE